MTDEQSSGAEDLQECPDCGGPQVPWSGGRCIGCEVRRTSLADARTLSRLHEAFVHALAQKGSERRSIRGPWLRDSCGRP